MISDIEIPFTKVLRPSMQEFSNFEEFVEGLDNDKTLQEYGMLKIVPPAKWKARKESVPSTFDSLTVSHPIEQNAQGHSGVYELLLIQKKSMKLNDYRKKVERFDNITDGKSVEEVEEMFWKNLAFSPPLYGADIGGTTLFDDGVAWNLNSLPGILQDGLLEPIDGVNNPYLYIGAWKTLFGWHKEDLDLNAVNYNHYGKPKLWYCLPVSESHKLEEFAQSQFPESFKRCKEFIRHKTFMISPYILKQKYPDIKIHKVIQYPGEFIVTYGGAYHAGFNWGFNIAEAVNFATTKWLKIVPTVNVCKCVNDSVKMQYKEFFKVLLEKTKYGKNPHIKKILSEHGISKDKKGSTKIEEEIHEEEKHASKRQRSSPKKRENSKKPHSKTIEIEEEEKERSKSSKRQPKKEKPLAIKRNTKIPLAKIKLKSTKKQEEDKIEQRISSRSKKIKKLEEDYFVTDWRGIRKAKREEDTKENHPVKKQEIKTHKNTQIIENWVQCDNCNKWRILRGDMNQLLNRKKLSCSNLPGRSCTEPEDKQQKDEYVLASNKTVIA